MSSRTGSAGCRRGEWLGHARLVTQGALPTTNSRRSPLASSTTCPSLSTILTRPDPRMPTRKIGRSGSIGAPQGAERRAGREAGKLNAAVEAVSLLRGAPGRIRTCDTRFRKPLLYPLSYGGGTSTSGATARLPRRSAERLYRRSPGRSSARRRGYSTPGVVTVSRASTIRLDPPGWGVCRLRGHRVDRAPTGRGDRAVPAPARARGADGDGAVVGGSGDLGGRESIALVAISSA